MSHALDVFALERAVLEAATVGTFLEQVDALRKLIAMNDPDIVAAALKIAAPKVEGLALGAVANAFDAGRTAALGQVAKPKPVERALRQALPAPATRTGVTGLDAAGVVATSQVARLARAGAEAAAVVAPLLAHANSIQRSVTYAVNAAGNEGVLAVADQVGGSTVWIAETDACVDCLAYSGQVSESDDQFPGGLTYGASSPFPDPLDAPPLHPNCRCEIEILNEPTFADALRREADRSVLRGFSLESERPSVRIDAAQRLLDKGVVAPKSVKAYAAKAIRDGGFPTRNR